jgi:hypothetical protein
VDAGKGGAVSGWDGEGEAVFAGDLVMGFCGGRVVAAGFGLR